MAKSETVVQAPEGATLFKSRYGMKPIYPDDTVIVGYPKSGTTWMRFLVANMMRPDEDVTFRNLQQLVPGMHQPEVEDPNFPRPRYIKTHFPAYDEFPRTIYIYRDVRDVMVSHYHYAVQKKQYEGNFSGFLRKIYQHKHYGPWHEHVDRAFEFSQRQPERIIILRYEDMLKDAVGGATRIAQFCGFDLTPEQIENEVSQCRFESLQKNEEKHGSIPQRRENFTFFRSGTAGQWGSMFSNGDMRFLMKRAGNTLKRLGYIE